MTDDSTALAEYQPPALAPAPKDEFQNAQRQATLLAKTNMVPGPYRGKPDDILAAWLYGRELGFALMQSVNNLDVVDGRPALRSAAMAALVNRAGHKLEILESTDVKATVRGTRKDTKAAFTFTWTIDMARRAQLAGKPNWKGYPEAMLLARAIAQVCRTLFPDVLRGMIYSSEELLDMVEVPAGAGPSLPPAAPATDADDATRAAAPADPLLEPGERDQLKRLFGDPVDPNDLRKGWSTGTMEGLKAAIDDAVANGCPPVAKLAELRRSHFEHILGEHGAAAEPKDEEINDEAPLT